MRAETQDHPEKELPPSPIGWRNLLFSFRGRISRRTYVTRVLVAQILISLALVSGVALLIFLAEVRANAWLFRGAVLFIAGAVVTLIWVNTATLMKRLHDRNRRGWFVLVALVPFANLWIYFEALFLRGRDRANRYGPSESSEFSSRSLVIALGIVAAVVPDVISGFARATILQPFNIVSGSTAPTLPIGDYFFVSKSAYGYSRYSFPFGLIPFDGRFFVMSEPERGDMVVFKFPPDNSTDYIMRLIGLPGDRIQMRDGVLYINDKAVPKERIEDYVETTGEETREIPRYRETLPNGVSYEVLDLEPEGNLDDTQVYVVPEGHYFMMGDNRDNSLDSRVDVGYVPFQNFVGKAQIIFFSTNGSARIWEVWKWPFAIRYDRMGYFVE